MDTINNWRKWEPGGLTPWNGRWQNKCHWGFKPDSRVHQLYTYPNRFSYEQTSTSSLGELTPTHPSTRPPTGNRLFHFCSFRTLEFCRYLCFSFLYWMNLDGLCMKIQWKQFELELSVSEKSRSFADTSHIKISGGNYSGFLCGSDALDNLYPNNLTNSHKAQRGHRFCCHVACNKQQLLECCYLQRDE
jgi:hypothetical protein